MKSVFFLFLANLILVNGALEEKKSEKFRQLEATLDTILDSSSDFLSDSSSDLISTLSSSLEDLSNSESLDSSTSNSTNRTEDSNSNNFELLVKDNLLLGFDNYIEGNDLIFFYAYVRYYQGEPKKSIDINLIINRNLRLLEEATANCKILENYGSDYITVYNCSLNNSAGSINNIQCDLSKASLNHTKLAENMCKFLQNQTGDKISKEGLIIINDCQITDKVSKITINGISEEKILNK